MYVCTVEFSVIRCPFLHRCNSIILAVHDLFLGSTFFLKILLLLLKYSLIYFCGLDVDEASKKEIKDILTQYDRTLLVADPRRCEPKKFGGPGPRARYQKSYR